MGKHRYTHRHIAKLMQETLRTERDQTEGEILVAVRRFLESLQRAVFMTGLLPSLLTEPFRAHVTGLYDARHARAAVLVADALEMLGQLRPTERYALVSVFVLGQTLGAAAAKAGLDSQALSRAALSGAAVLYGQMVANGYA